MQKFCQKWQNVKLAGRYDNELTLENWQKTIAT